MLFAYRVEKKDKNWKTKKILPTYHIIFEHVNPSAVTRRIFIMLNQYVCPENKPKFLKIWPILFNFNQFNNC